MGQTKWTQGKTPSHARIYRRQMDSVAWQHLNGSAVKVLLHLALLDRGKNNGDLFFSDRKGAELTGMNRNTVRCALRDLMDMGFIYCSVQGGFSRKTPHAACYGLTWEAGAKDSLHRAPSHAYEKWQPNGNTRAQFLTETGLISDQSMETDPCTGADIGPDEMEKPLVSAKGSMSEIGPHTSNQGLGAARPETDQRKQADPISRAILRETLKAHLAGAEPGEQSRLALQFGIPGGTLSKFINGSGLPAHHAATLARAIQMEAA